MQTLRSFVKAGREEGVLTASHKMGIGNTKLWEKDII
jgi:hypothetical protein